MASPSATIQKFRGLHAVSHNFEFSALSPSTRRRSNRRVCEEENYLSFQESVENDGLKKKRPWQLMLANLKMIPRKRKCTWE